MTQPSFEYLEDKKVLRQVPPPEPKPSSEYPDAMRSSDDWARWHDDHLKWVEVCASLPTYPVITPNEQWEREVRGRKDLKENIDFAFIHSQTEASPLGPVTFMSSTPFYAIPLPVQGEVERTVQSIRSATDRATESPEKAKQFLKDAGIVQEEVKGVGEGEETAEQAIMDLSCCLETICKEYNRGKLTKSAIDEGMEVLKRHSVLIVSLKQGADQSQ